LLQWGRGKGKWWGGEEYGLKKSPARKTKKSPNQSERGRNTFTKAGGVTLTITTIEGKWGNKHTE